MNDPELIKEFKEFSQNFVEMQQQYVNLVNQSIPLKETEAHSLNLLKSEVDSLPEHNVIYHSVGKIFLVSNIPSTQKMINGSIELNQKTMTIFAQKKSFLESSLKEASEKRNFYLSTFKT